jgi:L-amino acid N-acyltransferase YncA
MVAGEKFVSAYPKTVDCDGITVAFKKFAPAHLDAVQQFASHLAPHDLLFLTRDIQHPKVVSAWLDAISMDEISSLVAFSGDKVVGTTAIVRDKLGWSPHVAEIRLMIAAEMRGKGLGRLLLQSCIRDAVEAGAEKLTARMTPDQRGAIALFEEIGFRGEAMLRDQVKDRNGQLHDLAILSLNVARLGAHHGALGMAEAF